MTPELPFDPSSTPLARRVAWMIERFCAGELTESDVLANYAIGAVPDRDAADIVRRFKVFGRSVDEVLSYEEHEGRVALAMVRSGEDRLRLQLNIVSAEDDRIVAAGMYLESAAGVVTRPATEEDGPALRVLELRCPVVVGTESVSYDRGDDYFAQQRLMGDHFSTVAEYEGRVVGVFSDAIRPLRVGGEELVTTYRFHLRVDPDMRGKRIFPALNGGQGQQLNLRRQELEAARPGFGRIRVSGFVAASNDGMLTVMGPGQQELIWSVGIERMAIRCADHAGPAAGRAATPSDAAHIAAVLRASHGNEELSPVFSADWVTGRMERSADDYSWDDVLLTDGAVIGVWDRPLQVTVDDGVRTVRSIRATALDWGWSDEGAFAALLGAWCAKLLDAGTTHLVFITSAASPGRDLLAARAERIEPFHMTLEATEPDDTKPRGVFVDAVYF